MFTTNGEGLRVAYAAAGAGAAVVALHCSGSSGRQWRDLAPTLGAGYRVVAPDLYGSGDSDDWHGRRAIRLADHAALARPLIGGETARVHVVGHSFGGAVALVLALALGPRLASLTLIEPSAFHLLREGGAVERGHYAEIRGVAGDVSQAVLAGDREGAARRFVDYWNGAGAWAALKPEARTRLAAHAPKAATDFAALFAETRPLADYAAIAAPTLIVHGTRSPGPSRHICRLLDAALPDARTVAIDNAGHMAPMTHGAIVTGLIADHVRAATAPARRAA